MPKISVVINSLNQEEDIKPAINSVKWADEILVCDMYSDDQTQRNAKELGAKVIVHKREKIVELARNFAISKTSGDWILVLDPDERISEALSKRLRQIADKLKNTDFIEIPRKNIIFGKWLEHTGWWPDYQIRFFKKGAILWNQQIHSKPTTKGVGLTLEPEEKWAILHQNYQTISEFADRMNRYSGVQAEELIKSGYKFKIQDLFEKPSQEFLSRYFANKGYLDGLHGLVLSLLQAFSFLVLYLKVWEREKFKEQDLSLAEFEDEVKVIGRDLNYWINQSKPGTLKKFLKIFKK